MYTDSRDITASYAATVRGGHYSDSSLSLKMPPSAWNATQQSYPRDLTVPLLIARQAAERPNAVALVAGNHTLSYGELNQRANQLAHRLQTLIRPKGLIGLCVRRSFDMVIGLLGILKTGNAYVPLDPDYPPERLSFMLEDAQIPVLVTEQHLQQKLPNTGTQLIFLDTDDALPGPQNASDPPFSVSVDDLAYVIYTSGSTGLPKGVQITHDSLLNLVYWHQRAFQVTAFDRATQLTSPAFDATGWELWPYLTAGARVYLPDEETRVAPIQLQDWLLDCNITTTFLPTPLAESLIRLEWPEKTSLRLMLTGADTLHHYPPATLPFALVNNYGPTEATVVATSAHIPPTSDNDDLPSIGQPIDNVQIYILDEQMRQVPIGEPGELHIGGVSLAKGYLHRPELTAEKFVRHPFSEEPHARLYKTGDRARFLPDGQIAFMGRIDDQIKIRGYRIEPEEIISVLNEHPAVQTSIVIAREESPGEKLLVAYVLLTPGAQVTTNSLREILTARLPDYMIPAVFLQLDALPLTPNGKIDRDALPPAGVGNILYSETFVVPATPTEKQLAEIIASLLGLDPKQIGADDNFFLLGGSSMLGTQVITRVNSVFGIDLPQLTLFEAPTIQLLADEIESLILTELDAMDEDEIKRMLQLP